MDNNSALPEKTIYTVSELNRETKQLLSQYFMTINVEGEISNLSTPASGHIYFTLKDANAQIRCAMFRSYQRQRVFKPENGHNVIAKAQVGLYEARGDYQLIVESMEPAGDGALLRAFERLKNKLAEEGLFDADNKQALPLLPLSVGVITSPTGAVIHDILSVLQRRFPASKVIIYPVAVQGESAAIEVIQAITTANDRKECDCLILARGGGSLEDLSAFNDEALARTIAASKLPVLSAIGHETDFTIADFVADVRAPTPSAAAEYAVPSADHWLLKFKQLQNSLIRQVEHRQNEQSTRLKWLKQRLQQKQPKRELQAKAQRLDELYLRLRNNITTRLQSYRAEVSTQTANLTSHDPSVRLKFLASRQQALTERLEKIIGYRIKINHQLLISASQTLHAVSPLATLNRGYALVTDVESKRIILSTHQLLSGDIIQTQLANGQIISKIKELIHE
jgi:exodeoxyribonuclease VII large subunit